MAGRALKWLLLGVSRIAAGVLCLACATGAGAGAGAQEMVHFPSLDAAINGGKPTDLDGYLFRPSGGGKRPALVLLHGCGGLLNRHGQIQKRESDWTERLAEHGYVVLLVDSFAPRRQGSECEGGSRVTPQNDRPRDAYGALLYLQAQPFVRAERIGLMGWSHGGGTVLFTIDTLSAGRPAQLPNGDFRAAIAFYPGWCNEQAQRGSWTSAIPLLVLNGRADNWTPAGPCQAFVADATARGASIEQLLYEGAYHDFDWPGMPVHELAIVRKRGGAPITGMNPAAREDALARVPVFLDRYLQN